MPRNTVPKIAVCMAASFTGLGAAIIVLLVTKIISFEMGLLMLVALVGMHLGFGILIAVYRLIARLD
jgi:hypothetical protein